MKTLIALLLVSAGLLSVSCSNQTKIPSPSLFVGEWSADAKESTCSKDILSLSPALTLSDGGHFTGHNLPKEIAIGFPSIEGQWSVKQKEGTFMLSLVWKTPAATIFSGVNLIQKGPQYQLEAAIADPDLGERLVFTKRTQ